MLAGLFSLGLAGLVGQARTALAGPFGSMIVATVVAVIAVGSLAVGVAWLRGDAARDARAACEADHLQQAIIVERAKAEAFRRAGLVKDQELARRAAERESAAGNITRLEREKGELRAELDDLASARDIALPDDRWLRQGRSPPAPARR